MSKLIVVISGKRHAGKNTLANQLAAWWMRCTELTNNTGWCVNESGLLCSYELSKSADQRTLYPVSFEHGVGNEKAIVRRNLRILSFATPLKEFCINVLGLSPRQCYGTHEEKISETNLLWDGLPFRVRVKYSKRSTWLMRFLHPRSGKMTAREVMQVFGTDLIRSWCPDAWARSVYAMAAAASEAIVIIPDCRFPNEDAFKANCKVPVRTIRLERAPFPEDKHPSETAMDDYPRENFDLVLPADVTQPGMETMTIDRFEAWITNHVFGA